MLRRLGNMTRKSTLDRRYECPACGGGGGGPFGPAGSAWDDEGYVCPRCEGLGVVADGTVLAVRPLAKASAEPALRPSRPGIAQASARPPAKKKRVSRA
jgi:hypothetical protein